MVSGESIIKWMYLICATAVVMLLFMIFLVKCVFVDNDKIFLYKDLVDNYSIKQKELKELKNYIDSITPPTKSVHIEFESDDKLGIFHVVDQGNYNSNWDVDTDSFRADSLLRQLGWNRETVSTLKAKLDKANCISVQSGEPCTIGYQRSGLGIYSYNLFDNPLTDSLKTQYNDSCRYVVFAPKVVLEYGGGAIGPQCFPDFRR